LNVINISNNNKVIFKKKKKKKIKIRKKKKKKNLKKKKGNSYSGLRFEWTNEDHDEKVWSTPLKKKKKKWYFWPIRLG